MPVCLKIRGIGALKHKSKNFAFTTIYILGIDDKSREIYVAISCKVYLIDGLKENMLVDNDVLYIESFVINLFTSSALIHSSDVNIKINARQYSKFLRHKALASASIIVAPRSYALIVFQHIKLPDSRNFLIHLFS